MAYVEARQFSTGADIIAAARGVRDRLFRNDRSDMEERKPKFYDVEFTDQKETARDYGGMNPEFVKQAEAKARARQAINEEIWRKQQIQAECEYREKKRLLAEREREMREIQQRQIQQVNSDIAIAAYKSWEWGRKPSLKKQIMVLSDMHGIDYEQIVSAARVHHVLAFRNKFIRQIAEDNPDKSLVEIGRAFGNRDHTTIRNALVKAGCPSRGYPERGAA